MSKKEKIKAINSVINTLRYEIDNFSDWTFQKKISEEEKKYEIGLYEELIKHMKKKLKEGIE